MASFDLSVISWNSAISGNNVKTVTVEAVNKFSVDFRDQLRKKEKENLLYSSCSASASLAAVFAGAQGNTACQISEALGWNKTVMQDLHDQTCEYLGAVHKANSRKTEIHIATGFFLQKGIAVSEHFSDTIRKYYNSSITTVDFKKSTDNARREVNTWVKQQLNDSEASLDTSKKSGFGCTTKCILINTMTFKGAWLKGRWKPELTLSDFSIKSGKKVKVQMMKQSSNLRYCIISNLGRKGCQLLEVPLKQDSLSMVFLLPVEENGAEALTAVEDSLKYDVLCDVLSGASSIPPVKTEVTIPASLVFHEEHHLKDILLSLGIKDLWSQAKGDLSGTCQGKGNVHLSNVIHKVCVEITAESDLTSRVSTVAEEMDDLLENHQPDHVFCANQPFLFFVTHKATGTLLLSGRVVNPLIVRKKCKQSGGSSCVVL